MPECETSIPDGWFVVCASSIGANRFGVQIGKRSVMEAGATEKAEMLPGTSIMDDQPFLVRGAGDTFDKAMEDAIRRAIKAAQEPTQ